MNKPVRITFTGVDQWCAAGDLVELYRADSRVELGFLYSESKAGGDNNRYPSAACIEKTLFKIWEFRREPGHTAIHICGSLARQKLWNGQLPRFFNLVSRLQINGVFSYQEATVLRRFLNSAQCGKVITQHDDNERLAVAVNTPGRHQILFDASGGSGRLRKDWPQPLKNWDELRDWDCGYAGGLGPDNLRAELPRIAAAAQGQPYWIDMESSLRDDDDRFSVAKAMEALDAIHDVESVS